ncbi:MAG TPA: c-type cytochrome, methanol metabolism-related [Dongiaceae bacterium]|nr:c-type cytochrome, methanol metabolism-related [Dongiaceae bacterium]
MTGFRLFSTAVLLAATLILPFQNTASSAADDPQRYHIDPDGTVDWRIFNGYRRYHAICHTCHGPDGLGSSFAPNLTESLKTLSYDDFMNVVVNGKIEVNTAADKRMPALGTDPNVMCYIDDIYAYLKARSDGVVARGRPPKHENKPKEAADAEASCMGPATGN